MSSTRTNRAGQSGADGGVTCPYKVRDGSAEMAECAFEWQDTVARPSINQGGAYGFRLLFGHPRGKRRALQNWFCTSRLRFSEVVASGRDGVYLPRSARAWRRAPATSDSDSGSPGPKRRGEQPEAAPCGAAGRCDLMRAS